MTNTIKRVWNAVTTMLVSLAVLLALMLWGFRIIGMELFVVQSGSMEPNYPVGSVVYVQEVDAATLAAGDVITFNMGGGVRGTHRIIEVLQGEEGVSFRTKGDANEMEDQTPVLPENVVGKVRFSVPYLGYLINYIQQPPGTYVAVALVCLVMLLCILPDLIFPESKYKKQEGI